MDIIAHIENLVGLDQHDHWFCPRNGPDDNSRHFPDDCPDLLAIETTTEKEKRLQKLRACEDRRNVIAEAFKILAFDGDDAEAYWTKFEERLKVELARCEICVREFHRFRPHMKNVLQQMYDDADVDAYMDKYDTWNTARICEGLDSATKMLLDLPAPERGITRLKENAAGLFAMFETLNCIPLLLDEKALTEHFDQPFRLVQTNKTIKLTNFAPGILFFLFSSHPERSGWVLKRFHNIKRDINAAEFEHGAKYVIERAMSRLTIASLDKDYLPIFWKAMRLLLEKTRSELMADQLPQLQGNLFTLSLEHFQVDAPHLADMLECYEIFLQRAPQAFWEALGSISAQNVVDTILQSPALIRMFQCIDEKEPLELTKKLNWCVPLLRSLKPATMVPPIRSITHMLLDEFQTEEKYSRWAGSVCEEVGMSTLLLAMSEMVRLNGNLVVVHLLDHISGPPLNAVMEGLDGIEKTEDTGISENLDVQLQIVEKALQLDVQTLTRDRKVLESAGTLDHEINVSDVSIWRRIFQGVRNGHCHLPKSILGGLTGLLVLEPFTERQTEKTKFASDWNQRLATILEVVHDTLLGELETFDQQNLVVLYTHKEKGSHGLITLLFNADEKVHQRTLNLLKALCDQDNRRDCIMHLLTVYFANTLEGISKALKAVSRSEVYSACPVILKVCTDVYSCLCDPMNGLLRSSKTMKPGDVQTLKQFWTDTWYFIRAIFDKTEKWSQIGYKKDDLTEFCRAAMDFAALVFGEYSVLVSALEGGAGTTDSGDISKSLLETSNRTVASISKWLRLRDDYLIGVAVKLTSTMLMRLHDAGLQITKDAENLIFNHITATSVKNKLKTHQKAELRRALEANIGRVIVTEDDTQPASAAPRKQRTLTDWAQSGSSTPSSDAKPPGDVIDIDEWSTTSEAAKIRKQTAEEKQKFDSKIAGDTPAQALLRQRFSAAKPPAKKPASALIPSKTTQQTKPDDFLAKRKAEKEAAQKKNAEYLAKKKLGAGTGVEGLGDMGKDHTLKGQNVMVSSDEESEETDDELDEELFGNFGSKAKKVKPSVPDGMIGVQAPEIKKKGPTRIRRAVRSQKDMRARLAPDLSALHKVMLQWDYFFNGEYPPGSKEHLFRRVENRYMDSTTYQDTFEQLLTLEAWQGIARVREELERPKVFGVKILTRANVDHFVEISNIMGPEENREVFIAEGDLVLLSGTKQTPHQDANAPHCLSRVSRVKRQKGNIEVTYQVMSGSKLMPQLTPNTVVYGVKLQSLTPLEREFGALKALQYYDLCQQIIQARPSARMDFSEKQIVAYQDNWKVNRAQSEAINAALENEGFSLIQGPPGSGKTKTIIAIVGGILSQTLSSGSSTSMASAIRPPSGRGSTAGDINSPAKKLLVCAPSNAAVDELVMRLKQGVTTQSGRHVPLKVVRIGRSDAINSQVLDVTMDELLAKRLGNSESDQKNREKNAAVFKEHETVSSKLKELHKQKDDGKLGGKELKDLEQEIAAVRKRKNDLGIQIDKVKDQERNASREQELNRKKAQQAILDESHVICATLSGSGHDMFRTLNIEFETIIIDEAAQCVEMSSLIPLKYGCIKCIMVGDPKQLPPTVFSHEARKFQYEQSLFVRMQNNSPGEVYLLDTQYRMHPSISLFPSRTFYDGLLKDGKGLATLRKKAWHSSSLLAPYRFFDVKGQQEKARIGGSLTNKAEVEVAIALFKRVLTDFQRDFDFNKGQIGIITPYKSQLRLLKSEFARHFDDEKLGMIEFNTTDAFQGRESEIIIFSCVRASPQAGIGFLQDIRRMNVGLTRAKSSLWVLGHSDSLSRGQYWKKLIDDARDRDSYTSGDILDLLRKPSSSFKVDSMQTTSMLDVSEHVPQMQAKEERRTSVHSENRASVSGAGARVHAGGAPKQPPASDRMEGVRKSLADYTAGKKMEAKSATQAEDGDVEMEDAPETEGQKPASSGNKLLKPPPPPPAMMKKRPASTSVFMPKAKKPAPSKR